MVTQGPEGFKPAFEVETSSQFLSLASRRVEKDDDRDDRDDRGATFGFRRPSLSRSASRWPNCSRERIKFYEYFSVLIELGSKAKRKREEQMRKAPTHQAPEAFRNELKDVLWLELQVRARFGLVLFDAKILLVNCLIINKKLPDSVRNLLFHFLFSVLFG